MTDEEVELIYNYLHENYEYVDGELIRKVASGSAPIGRPLGSLSYRDGNIKPKIVCMLYIKGRSLKKPLANLIYLFHYKKYPLLIRFKDNNITNCSIDNLEEIYSRENSAKGYSLKRSNSVSKYRAMVQDKNRKQISLGSYETVEECKAVYDFARKLQMEGIQDEATIKEKTKAQFPSCRIRIKKSGALPLGVSNVRNRFLAKLSFEGKQVYLGSYDNESIAHNAYLCALQLKNEGSSIDQIIPILKDKFPGKSFGRSKGFSRKRSKYQASIFSGKKRINLGLFDTPEEAHEAYLKARAEHANP